MVAALGDLEVRRPPGAGPDPGGELPAGQDVLRAAVDDRAVTGWGLDGVGDAQQVARADEDVHLWQRLPQFIGVALGEAPGDDEAAVLAAGLDARQVEDGVDRLLLGRGDEAAGVDDQHVGCLRVEHQLVAAAGEHAEHDLGVDLVLRTTEGDEVDAPAPGRGCPHRRVTHGSS